MLLYLNENFKLLVMQVFVCVKQALDWSRSSKDFRIDPQTQGATVTFPHYRIDQFDEIAVEIAVQLHERSGIKVRAVSVGPESAEDMLKHVLSMKVDAATLVTTTSPDTNTAQMLCGAIQGHGGAAIILCGRVSSDNGTAATGPRLAEMLGMPCITNVIDITGQQGNWMVKRETAHGHEVLAVTIPFVATVTNAKNNVPRTPTMKDKMWAFRQQVEILDNSEVIAAGARHEKPSSLHLVRRYVPLSARECRKIEGDARQKALALAEYVRKIVLRKV